MALSPTEAYALLRAAGFSAAEATTGVMIGAAESGLNPSAIGDVGLQNGTWGPSVGWLQIRSLKAQSGTGGARDATRLTDPAFNARAARQIYLESGWKAWSTYTSGAYQRALGAPAVGSIQNASFQQTGWTDTLKNALPFVSPGAGVLGNLLKDGAQADDLNPLKEPMAATGDALGGAAGSAISGVVDNVMENFTSLSVRYLAATAGLALVVIGVSMAVSPAASRAASIVGMPGMSPQESS